MKNLEKENQNKAFTLIELLVVIAIIGILSGVVLAAVSSARENARYTQAEQEMEEIKDLIILAQGNEGDDLVNITEEGGCTGCDYRSDPTTDFAKNYLKTSLVKIYEAANKSTSTIDALITDPWGNAYGLDENEGETGPDDCDKKDWIRTFGPNNSSGGGDDVIIKVPFGHSCL